jgi:hypothetical protein
MNVLAREIAITPHGRLGTWAAKAWRRMGWRQVLLVVMIELVTDAINPLGGVFFAAAQLPGGGDPVAIFLSGFWVIRGMAIVYLVLIADEAFNDGVPAVRAYGLTALLLPILVQLAERLASELLFASGLRDRVDGRDEGVAQFLWWFQVYLYEAGFGLSMYGYWRVTQRAMQQARAAETEHVRNEQRVQTARLLALQSRVEPQMLFDALGRVGELHGGDPQAADALLADMIALLRAMQPSAKTDTSTVEREFALVEAWLRVTRSVRHEGARVQLQMTPEAPSVGIAPMLVLPLLRAVLVLPRAGACEWRLNARVAGPRVVITLHAATEASTALPALADVDLSSLRDRLAQLFGQSAQLTKSPRPPSVTLDLPRLQEEHDDHDRTDR